MSAHDEVQMYVTAMQARMRRRFLTAAGIVEESWHPPLQRNPRLHVPNRRADLRRTARWWELEAMRGYPSSGRSLEYAANLRWLVGLLDAGIDIDRPFHALVKERVDSSIRVTHVENNLETKSRS